MYDPNNSVSLLSIGLVEKKDVKTRDYESRIINSWHWVSKDDPKNKTGKDCIPVLICIYSFNDTMPVGSFVVTQPKCFYEEGKVSTELSHQISSNIAVHLSMITQDDPDDDIAQELLMCFAKSDFEYSIAEGYLYFSVNSDGYLRPSVNATPYWFEGDDDEQ